MPVGVAEIGADRQRRSVLERRSPRADLDAGIFRLALERIGRAVRAAHVEPEPEPLRIGSGRLVEAGFVHRAEPAPARIAVAALTVAIGLARMRSDDLEEIEGRETVLGDLVPEAVVAAGPDQPHVPALNLVRTELRAVVHVVEEVFARLRQARLVAPRALRLVQRRRSGTSGKGNGRQSQTKEKDLVRPTTPSNACRPPRWNPLSPVKGRRMFRSRDGPRPVLRSGILAAFRRARKPRRGADGRRIRGRLDVTLLTMEDSIRPEATNRSRRQDRPFLKSASKASARAAAQHSSQVTERRESTDVERSLGKRGRRWTSQPEGRLGEH